MFIVVYFYPIAFGVLKINLLNAIGAHLRVFGGVRPIAILYIERVEVFGKSFYRRYAEGKVNIDIVRRYFFGALHYMQIAMVAHLKPYVFVVVKWLSNFFQLQHIAVEIGTFLHIHHVNGEVIEMNLWLCGCGRLRHRYGGKRRTKKQAEE
jgi:hypothetical protein